MKAVIFDCFGVLTTEAWLAFKAKYFAHDPELFAEVSDISHQADKGLISHEEAVHRTAMLAGITPAEFLEAIERYVPNEELFDYANKLKSRYKLGLLSNVAGNYLHKIFSDKQLGMFDVIVLSFQNGYIKPQPEAFTDAAKKLGVELHECVFIDDQERNVNGARAAGMKSVLYKDVASLKQELGAMLST